MKKIVNGKGRLNLKIPADLLVFANAHAAKNNTTITQLVVDYFTELQKKHRGLKKEAEQF